MTTLSTKIHLLHVQAVWQGANRPKETDLHPVKKLVAGFHLPNHENILSKVRNQGEEVA